MDDNGLELKKRLTPAQKKKKKAEAERAKKKAKADELAKLAGLDQAWASFAEMLGETEVSLEEHKESFRDKLTRMVDKLVNDVDEFEASFAATAGSVFLR